VETPPDPKPDPPPASATSEAPAAPPVPASTAAPEPEPTGGSPIRFWAKLAALLFFIAYATAFVVGNHRSISIDFVFGTAHVSLIWTILLLLCVGLIGGALGAHLYGHRRRDKRGKP
jgi:uncharacterized integral membrane protein